MTTFGELDAAATAALDLALRRSESVDAAGLQKSLEAVTRLVHAGQARSSSARRPDIAQVLGNDIRRVLAVLPADSDQATTPLHRTADLLGAAADLLASHTVITARGPVDRTDLAAIIDSPDGRAQTLRTAGRYASALSTLGARKALDIGAPALGGAARILVETGEATVWASRHAGSEFLAAVPVIAPLARDEPVAGESPDQLLDRAADGAERMHLLAFRAAQREEWIQHPPESMARAALAMAATAHTTGRLLRHLARQQNDIPQSGLFNVAALTDLSYEAWATIQERWHGIRAALPPGVLRPTDLEAGDLVTRVGRLAYPDPQWTPRLGASEKLRPLAEIAPDAAALDGLLAGLHRLAIKASLLAGDHANLTHLMARGGSLLVPTSTLPPAREVRRPWSPAPSHTTTSLTAAYDVARHACVDAADATAALVRDPGPALSAQFELDGRRAAAGRLGRRQQQAEPRQVLERTELTMGVER